jgi:hypothetical protein
MIFLTRKIRRNKNFLTEAVQTISKRSLQYFSDFSCNNK